MGEVNEQNPNPYSWFSSIPPFKKIKDRDEMYRNFGSTKEEIDIVSKGLEEKVKFTFEDLSKKEGYFSRIIRYCKNYLTRNRNK